MEVLNVKAHVATSRWILNINDKASLRVWEEILMVTYITTKPLKFHVYAQHEAIPVKSLKY